MGSNQEAERVLFYRWLLGIMGLRLNERPVYLVAVSFLLLRVSGAIPGFSSGMIHTSSSSSFACKRNHSSLMQLAQRFRRTTGLLVKISLPEQNPMMLLALSHRTQSEACKLKEIMFLVADRECLLQDFERIKLEDEHQGFYVPFLLWTDRGCCSEKTRLEMGWPGRHFTESAQGGTHFLLHSSSFFFSQLWMSASNSSNTVMTLAPTNRPIEPPMSPGKIAQIAT